MHVAPDVHHHFEPDLQRRNSHMQAIMYHKYGSPDVLELQEIEKPAPMENEVLVKVHAAAANPIDWHTMRAKPILVRLGNGFLDHFCSL